MKMAITTNFTRKLTAVLAAILIWALVNHSITTTKMFPRVTCRVVNMPHDKTIRGLMPNGTLDRKINLTLTGRKAILENLDSNEFEVVIDAASQKGDEWIVQVGKKNLVSLNPDIDLLNNVTSVTHNEFPLRLSRLVTEKIPVYFTIPQGEPPEGYQFLDITPQLVTHTLSGPEEDINELLAKGFELTFSLSAITKEELDAIKESGDKDEISFLIPEEWKRVRIPFLGGLSMEINDPEAKDLRITFLRDELLPLDHPLPLRIFYPVSTSGTINPLTTKIEAPPSIEMKEGLMFIKTGLSVSNVSRLFLDVVRDRMEVVVVVDEVNAEQPLSWDVQFVDPEELEDKYVSLLLTEDASAATTSNGSFKAFHPRHSTRLAEKERYLRLRFRDYMQHVALFMTKDERFQLDCRYTNGVITIKEF